jgi:pSer/pThr/pTyr-binding forkhead associated (FHA) protein
MDDYDALHLWLGIPPEEQPPSHYRLLGIRDFESNLEVIRNAADRQTVAVKRLGVNAFQEIGQDLLNQITDAKLCLLKPDRKEVYDRDLKKRESSRISGMAGSKPSMNRSTIHGASKQVWKVGSDAKCDLLCKSKAVSSIHCSITLKGGKTYVEDLQSTNGTFVNGKRTVGETVVLPFDLIVLGRETRLRLPEYVFAEQSGPSLFGVIGRNPQCELHISNETISTFHARFWLTNADLFLEDLNSTNGTRLIDEFGKKRKIQSFEPVRLDGIRTIGVGSHQLTIEYLRAQLAATDSMRIRKTDSAV